MENCMSIHSWSGSTGPTGAGHDERATHTHTRTHTHTHTHAPKGVQRELWVRVVGLGSPLEGEPILVSDNPCPYQ
eukprot:1084198-Pyramimonas_sp.AAC.1